MGIVTLTQKGVYKGLGRWLLVPRLREPLLGPRPGDPRLGAVQKGDKECPAASRRVRCTAPLMTAAAEAREAVCGSVPPLTTAAYSYT